MARLLRTSLVIITAFALAPVGAAPAAPVTAPAERIAAPALKVRPVARSLAHPWDVQQAPGGRLVVSERDRARISVVRAGKRRTLADLSKQVWVSGETGLSPWPWTPVRAPSGRVTEPRRATATRCE